MHMLITETKNKVRPVSRLLLLGMAILIIACGGGLDGATEDNEPPPDIRQTSSWESFNIVALDSDPITPNVIARVDNLGQVHIFYYEEGELFDGNQVRYQIKHAIWDPVSTVLVGEIDTVDLQAPNPAASGDSGLNNAYLLDADFTPDGIPLVAYQGGNISQAENGLICNMGAQADLMVNLFEGGTWNEYTGIQGDASPKNPLFTDGYVGLAGSIAVDSNNNIHLAAQHYYEFCDYTSTSYPDLLYVVQSPGDLGNYSVAMEEAVDDYNTFGGGGGIQTDMGHYAKLVLDQDEQPMIFYVGTPSPSGVGGQQRSLRMARKTGGVWIPEVIEELNLWDANPLSPAVAADGTIAVAYFMQNESDSDYPDHLRYAVRQPDGSWRVTAVDTSSHCGDFCSLAFDANNRPTIAYYDIHANSGSYRTRNNLKLARFNGSSWQTETVSTSGVVGLYNTLWFDADNVANICTYEFNDRQIIIFRELNN